MRNPCGRWLGLGVVLFLVSSMAGCAAGSPTLPAAGLVAPASPASQRCPAAGALARAGAARQLGLNSVGAATPRWSTRIGLPSAIEGGTVFGIDGECLVATTIASGTVRWVASTRHDDYVGGVAADATSVLASTGRVTKLGVVFAPIVNGLAVYDPGDGALRWRVSLAEDGQGLPAVLADGLVVVSQADGVVVGLSEATGILRWQDPPPPGCLVSSIPLQPPVTVLGSGPVVAVGYPCETGPIVVGISPQTGTVRWTWSPPFSFSLYNQASVELTDSDGDASDGVVAVVLDGPSGAAAGPTGAALAHTTVLAARGAPRKDTVILDLATGRPRWELDGTTDGVMVGGSSRLCQVSKAGIDCRDSTDGTASWSWSPPVSTALAAPLAPVMKPIPGIVCANGEIYLAAPTSTTPGDVDTPRGDIPALPVRFVLTGFDLTDGRIAQQLPLPAFNGGSLGIEVSLAAPPGVTAAGDGMVLVSPQLHENDIIEAFAAG